MDGIVKAPHLAQRHGCRSYGCGRGIDVGVWRSANGTTPWAIGGADGAHRFDVTVVDAAFPRLSSSEKPRLSRVFGRAS